MIRTYGPFEPTGGSFRFRIAVEPANITAPPPVIAPTRTPYETPEPMRRASPSDPCPAQRRHAHEIVRRHLSP